jgi:hypothetical protein
MSPYRWHLRATWTLPLALCVPALMGADGDGCNGSGGHPAGDGGRADSPDSAPALVIGQILAQQFAANSFIGNSAAQYFDVSLAGPDTYAAYGTCAGAAETVGDCCYFPPSPPPGLQPFDSGSPVVDQTAGVITLVDTTSKAHIGSFHYVTDGYPTMTFPAPVWAPGDILTVSATGGQISAFTVSAPALIPPIGQVPSSISLTHDFQITWQPDPNADIMNIWISDGQSSGKGVNCTLPDANGSVTVASSLFAAFQSGEASTVSLGRIAQRDAQTSTGTVVFATRAYSASFQASVQ